MRGCVWIQGAHVFRENEFGLASIRRRDSFPRNQQQQGTPLFISYPPLTPPRRGTGERRLEAISPLGRV